MDLAVLYLLGALVSLGSTTVFLRLALNEGNTNGVRLVRALSQTVVIVIGFSLLFEGASIVSDLAILYPLLNGILGGLAFIAFSRGLKTVDAGRAKPIIVVNLVIPVSLGIIVLGKSFNLYKSLGVLFSVIAVYLLSSEPSEAIK